MHRVHAGNRGDLTPMHRRMRISVVLDERPDIHMEDVADIVFGQQAPDDTITPHVMRRRAKHRCPVCELPCVVHPPGIRVVQRHPRLAEHVLSSFKGCHRVRTVQIWLRANPDRVNLVRRDQCLRCWIRPRDAVLGCCTRRAFMRAVHHACQFDARHRPQTRHVTCPTDCACADETDSYAVWVGHAVPSVTCHALRHGRNCLRSPMVSVCPLRCAGLSCRTSG